MAVKWVTDHTLKQGGYWKADYFWGPKKTNRSQTRHPTRQAAEWDAYLNSHARSHFLRGTMLLSTALDAYEKSCAMRGQIHARRDTDRLRKLLGAHIGRPASALTRDDFIHLHSQMALSDANRPWLTGDVIDPRPFTPCWRALKPATIGKYFTQLAAFSYFCMVNGFRDDDPVYGLAQQYAVPVEPPDLVVPVESHLDTMHARIGLVSRVILGLIAFAGAEPIEATRARWGDMDARKDRIFLRHTVLRGDDPDHPSGRWVPLDERLKLDLMALRAALGGSDDDLVVPPGDRERLCSVDIIAQVRVLQVLSGFKGKASARSGVFQGIYRAAQLRNYAAVQWCKKHRNVRVIAELMNMSERTVEMRYDAIIHLKDDMAAYHARDVRRQR